MPTPKSKSARHLAEPWKGLSCALLLAASNLLSGCASGQSPKSVLRSYAEALADGHADDAYRLLSDDAKKTISPESFRLLVKQNRAEALELGRSLGRPTDDPYVTAVIPLPSGETVTMILEDGRWKVDTSSFDFYSQSTPRQAIAGFVRAFSRKRYDVLLRFAPEAMRTRLTDASLMAAWGAGKKEGSDLEGVVEAIRVALPTASLEETGDRASMTYGTAGLVTFLREKGVWKIEDLR